MDKNILKDTIKKANLQYRIGEPIEIKELPKEILEILEQKEGELTDKSYDFLLDTLYKIDPNNEIFDKGIIENWEENQNIEEISVSTRKEPLDKPMYSLDKMKSVPEVDKWGKKKGLKPDTLLIATAKYDGVSSLTNEKTLNAHSRGDGIDGQNITEHLNKYKNYKPASFEFYTIGELIIPKQVFENNEFKRDNGEIYKNPRNMVAGLVNNDDVSDHWKFVDHVRYGIADEEFEYDKLDHFKIIKKETGFETPYEEILFSELTTEKLDELYYKWGEKYEIDGIVLEVNDKDIRKKLGRERNNNPAYAIAYKSDWTKPINTTVIFNFWDVSKEGYVKPVVNVVPFDIEGVTISRATGYNARFILDNKIGVGTILGVIRSGSVIPKIVNIIEPTQADIPTHCPSCNTELIWNKSGVELMCTNDKCEAKNIKKIAFFFKALEADNISDGIIKQLYDSGYTTIKQILNLTENDLEKIDRFGKRKSSIVYESIKKSITNVELSKLQHASCLFKNLGSKKLKLLEHFDNKPLFDDIISIDGFSDISAKSYLDSYDKFYEFIKNLPIKIKEKSVIIENNDIKNMSVVFTGIRRKDLSDIIEAQGGKILSGISRNVTHLVCKDVNSNSSKMIKAKDLGIKILNVKDLEDLIS